MFYRRVQVFYEICDVAIATDNKSILVSYANKVIRSIHVFAMSLTGIISLVDGRIGTESAVATG